MRVVVGPLADRRMLRSGGVVVAVLALFASADIPECSLTVPQLVAYNGYPCETHEVVARDGSAASDIFIMSTEA